MGKKRKEKRKKNQKGTLEKALDVIIILGTLY